jgi:hypothetical protein
MLRYLGGGRKLDLGPGAPTARPAYSVGGRLTSDPLPTRVGITGSSIYVRHGDGAQRPSVWVRTAGGAPR